MPPAFLEVVSALLGIGGALLLATRCRWAGWAFVLWLVSNCGWMVFAFHRDLWWLFAQHLAFAMSSVLGIWTWRGLMLAGDALRDDGIGDES